MESWRERGFVPDSDDEDGFDNQKTIEPSVDGRDDAQVSGDVAVEGTIHPEESSQTANGNRAGEERIGSSEETGGSFQRAISGQSAEGKDNVDGTQTEMLSEVASASKPAREKGQGPAMLSTTNGPDLPDTPNAKSSAPQAKKSDVWDVPSSPDELQLDNWHTQRPAVPSNIQRRTRNRSMSESSSQSALSSPPASSPPASSPPVSLHSLHLGEDGQRQQGQVEQEQTLAPPRDDLDGLPPAPSIDTRQLDDGQGQVEQDRRQAALRDDLEDLLPALDIPDDVLQELSQPARRSLRQRNPIQMHPYLLEDAKYQNIMKARGVKPVRIAQYRDALRAAANDNQRQEHAALQPPSSSPVPDGQFPPSSPPEPRQLPQRRAQLDTPVRGNFTDPPPLDQPSTGTRRPMHKRRKIYHGNSMRDRQHQQDLPQGGPENGTSRYLNRPGIPPSPPRSGSVSSAHTADFSGGFRFPRGATPPPLTTPVTESKLLSTDIGDANAMDLSGSMPDQPSADAVSISSQSQPNSDEEDESDNEVRQMRRQIKGILPASWLRLDLKNQEERMRSKQSNHDSAHRSENAKGVAKRVKKSYSGARSRPRQQSTSMMDLADNDEYEKDDGNENDKDSIGDASQALADLVGFEDPFQDQAEDDIPEDNRIDYMLPPIPRGETPEAFVQEQALSPAEDVEYLQSSFRRSGGLFGFQPSYAINFGIAPVCPGTFFHESTFLGSGEFSRSQKLLSRDLDNDAGSVSIALRGRNCHWGAWNETVSSELGSAFDMLIEDVEKNGSVSSEVDRCAISTQGCAMYRSLIKYITEALSFIDPVDRAGFVTRAHDLVSKLNERLSAFTFCDTHGKGHLVKLCSYNLVLASQVRHIASHSLVDHSLANDALGLVHSVARQLFAFFSSEEGLAETGKFLEDTKISVRRDAGVRDNPSVEAFVIARHLLCGSDKYEGWFESIFTELCLPSSVSDSKDIRSLETGWRRLFTALPLNEIDQFGIARIGSRFTEAFDNWKFVRQLLSRVLDDHGSKSSGQPISYINYCRALFRRCFHLINDWGWRNCKPALDTLYDFFAGRMLYNLKHEECFGSPNFLEDLDRDPSLAVTPRDSCFHILLKIIGSGLRFMSKTHEKKKIRNSAWRLLPNHGRVYPKEMPLRQEDLDALRNHHDLLCTLYWAVPEGCRPRLEAIKNLVDPASSHRETCKISLRSWMRLIRFKLSTDEDVSGLDPFSNWHSYFVIELLKQHSHARTEIEAQSNGDGRFSHQVVEKTISQNQQQIELLLNTALGALQSAVQLSPTVEHARRLVSKTPTKAILGLFNSKFGRVNSIVAEALRVVVAYTKKCDAPPPAPVVPPAPAVALSSDDDSQEYGDWKEIFEQEDSKPSEGIEHVQRVFHPAVSRLVSNCFGDDHSPEEKILLDVVDCWTSVAQTLARHGLRYWDSYLSPYDGDSWTALRSTVQMRKFTPQFLASCIEKDSRFLPECKAQVLGLWMSTLVERTSMLKYQHRLSEALLNHDPANPLLKNLPFSKNRKDDRYSVTLEEFSQRRLSLISSVLSNMREHVQGMEDVEGWEYKVAKQEYNELIQRLMASMRSNYQELGNGVQSTQGAYVDFVHCVIGFLQQHTRDISAIDPFFTDPKSFPLPSADPRYIVAKLKSYEPKLSSENAVKALIVFIQGVSERAASDGEQVYLVNQLHVSMANTFEGGSMNRPTLRAVLLQCAFPAYLEVAFNHPAAWIMSRPIAQTITLAFKELLLNMDTTDPSCVSSVTNIFTSVFRGTYQAFHFLSDDPEMLKEPTVLVTATTFIEMITASLPVIEYIDRATESGDNLILQVQAFRQFALFALSRIRDETLPYSLEEFSRLSSAFTTADVHDAPASSAPTLVVQQSLRHSASRELLSYIAENYSRHQGKYYFTRRGGGSQPKEVKIDPAVAAKLDSNVPELEFENAVNTFIYHLQRLDMFG
ncbi:hypothetical protein PHISP_02918 [Aspergillus sp. HF37]|nr:hypothetical protein PHISP_02918 [Aspergillus sp. HF37]